MSLSVGARLGHYAVTAKLGEGGMGEVWRATDTQLNRDVALKILPDAFATDPDRLARFQREAHVLASLNHPGIAAIYGIEEQDDTRALVLELVEGPTLADRISKGPIPLDEALPIAKQIAEALEAAHEAGVIHRDLKPANIKVKDDGTVKVLDFGLAKALDPNPTGDPSQSPTLTAAATQMGVIMGTAAYMSPEQARGKPVDKRADIWAFGAVLFEMLTGRRAFGADEVSDSLALILTKGLDWTLLPSKTPEPVRRILRRCLEKDALDRLRDVGDARVEIKTALSSAEVPSGLEIEPRTIRFRSAVLRVAPLALVGLALWVWLWPLPEPEQPARWLNINLPNTAPMAFRGSAWREFRSMDLSSDGMKLIYVAELPEGGTRLYLRSLHEQEFIPLEGTDGASFPFFSPDGLWVGFVADGELRKASVDGRSVIVLGDVQDPFGATWITEDEILVSQGGGLSRFSATSGQREDTAATCSEIARGCWLPDPLPGSEWVLVSSYNDVAVVSLRTGERRTLLDSLHLPQARVLPNGYIAYFHRPGQLFAVPFDMDHLEVTGAAIPVLEDVRHGADGQFDVSVNGTLVFASGNRSNHGRFTWVDRTTGQESPLPFEPQSYGVFNISPDGRYLATTGECNAEDST